MNRKENNSGLFNSYEVKIHDTLSGSVGYIRVYNKHHYSQKEIEERVHYIIYEIMGGNIFVGEGMDRVPDAVKINKLFIREFAEEGFVISSSTTSETSNIYVGENEWMKPGERYLNEQADAMDCLPDEDREEFKDCLKGSVGYAQAVVADELKDLIKIVKTLGGQSG